MRNTKGFTLVELVVTVAILLLLSTVAVISVTTLRGDTNEKIDEAQENLIIDAAEKYYVDYLIENPDTTNMCVEVNDLINDGYLKNNNSSIEGRININVSDDKTTYTYNTGTC